MQPLGTIFAIIGALIGPALGCLRAATVDPPRLALTRPSKKSAQPLEHPRSTPRGPSWCVFSGPMGTDMEQYVDLHRGDVGGPMAFTFETGPPATWRKLTHV